MDEFYRLPKTKPLSSEELYDIFSNAKVLCLCDSFQIASRRRFHAVEHINITEWQALRDKYPDISVYICGPYCQCFGCKLLEKTDIYTVWRR